MNKEQLDQVCDETAIAFFNEFHAIVGGTFDRDRWKGMLANYYKKALSPFATEAKVDKKKDKKDKKSWRK